MLFTSSDAEVLMEPRDTFVIGSLLTARVGDADLNTDPLVADEVDVLISSDTGLSGTLTLIEQGENRGVFAASLPEEYSNVEVGTLVTMTYTDASAAVDKSSSTEAIAETTPILTDVSITDFSVPDRVFDGATRNLKLSITNDKSASEAATGSALV